MKKIIVASALLTAMSGLQAKAETLTFDDINFGAVNFVGEPVTYHGYNFSAGWNAADLADLIGGASNLFLWTDTAAGFGVSGGTFKFGQTDFISGGASYLTLTGFDINNNAIATETLYWGVDFADGDFYTLIPTDPGFDHVARIELNSDGIFGVDNLDPDINGPRDELTPVPEVQTYGFAAAGVLMGAQMLRGNRKARA